MALQSTAGQESIDKIGTTQTLTSLTATSFTWGLVIQQGPCYFQVAAMEASQRREQIAWHWVWPSSHWSVNVTKWRKTKSDHPGRFESKSCVLCVLFCYLYPTRASCHMICCMVIKGLRFVFCVFVSLNVCSSDGMSFKNHPLSVWQVH